MKKFVLSLAGVLLLLPSVAGAAEIYEDLARKFFASYPPESYIIGVGVVQSSGDAYKDRRRTEILARLELARVIKTATKGKSVDIMCEGKGKLVFDDTIECQNQLVQIVEESVDEVLEGSKIVGSGEEKVRGKDMYYAVAVLPKKDAIAKVETGSREAMEKAKEHIEKAKSTPDDATKKEETKIAREELKKSVAYESGKAAIEQVRQNSDDLMKALADETKKLEGR